MRMAQSSMVSDFNLMEVCLVKVSRFNETFHVPGRDYSSLRQHYNLPTQVLVTPNVDDGVRIEEWVFSCFGGMNVRVAVYERLARWSRDATKFGVQITSPMRNLLVRFEHGDPPDLPDLLFILKFMSYRPVVSVPYHACNLPIGSGLGSQVSGKCSLCSDPSNQGIDRS